jgi:menaquinone-dependent protoporphyrinogen oxidase
MISDALVADGCEVVLEPARDVREFADVQAVIVAGALYANRWDRHARRFVRRNTAALRKVPVWLVSSGPLNDSAETSDIPPTRQLVKLANRVSARGQITFGGRLAPDARGFPARAMAKTTAGDWRDGDHVRRWVASVARELRSANAVQSMDSGPRNQ